MLKQQRHTAYSVGHHSSSSGLRARAIPDKESSDTYYDQVHRLQSILDEVPSLSNDAFARPSILAMFLLQLQVTIISTIEALSYLLRPLERMFLFGTFARCAHQMVRGFLLIALVLAENVSQTFGVDQEMSSLRCNGHNHDHPHPKETIEYQSPYQIESTSAASSAVTDDPQTPDLPTRRESPAPVPESKEVKDKQQEKEEEQEETLNHVDGKSSSRLRCTSTPVFAPVVETKVRTRSLSNNMSVIIAGPPKTSSTSSLPSKSPVLSSFPHHSRPLSLRRVMGQRDLIHGNRSTLAGHSAPMLTTSSSARTTDTEPIYLVHRSLHRSASTTFGAAPGNHRA